MSASTGRSDHPRDFILRWLLARIDRIQAHRIIAQAIIDGRQAMADVKKPPPNMPNLAGLSGAFAKYVHGVEHRAGKAITRLSGEAEAHADDVFRQVHREIDDRMAGVDAVKDYMDEMKSALGNGFQEDSKDSSATSAQDAEKS